MAKRIVWALVLCLIPTALLANGVVLRIDTEQHQGGQINKTVTTMYISGENVKIKTDNNPGYFIFHGDKDRIWLVDDEKRQYTEIDEALMVEIRTAVENMQKQLEHLPPAQRDMAESMMQRQMQQLGASPGETDFTFKQTADQKTINEYPCRKIEVFKDEQKTGDLWLTDWDNIEYKQEIETAYVAMVDFINNLTGVLNESEYQPYMQVPFLRYGEGAEGMTVAAVHYDAAGNIVNRNTMQKIASQDLPPETFQAPDGYRLYAPEVPSR